MSAFDDGLKVISNDVQYACFSKTACFSYTVSLLEKAWPLKHEEKIFKALEHFGSPTGEGREGTFEVAYTYIPLAYAFLKAASWLAILGRVHFPEWLTF